MMAQDTPERVREAIQADGGLDDGVWFLRWTPGQSQATLDGEFTAAELRAIADHMDGDTGGERAAVVAWLREQADKLAALNDPDDKLPSFVIQNWRMIADIIAAGAHRKD